MSEIPSFFTRLDFISFLLPGYVPIIAYILIFQKQIFLEKQISVDIFSAVVFVVAGPAIGLTLHQFTQGMSSIWHRNIRRSVYFRDPHRPDEYQIRARMTAEEKSVIDEAKALYEFCVSTSLGLIAVSALVVFSLGWLRPEILVLLGGSAMLLIGAYFHPNSYIVIYRRLYADFDQTHGKSGSL